jgi:hypothetical protein
VAALLVIAGRDRSKEKIETRASRIAKASGLAGEPARP